jgi:hypothetical protein
MLPFRSRIPLAQGPGLSKAFRVSSQDGIETLLATPEPPDLGPGPRPGVQDEIALEKQLKPLFVSEEMPVQKQQLVRALILLWHDHLDHAHEIAQDIATPDGSFVHAIMHRREPDYGNAKYWFHRVGKHPAYPRIAGSAGSFLNAPENGELRQALVPGGEWDPFAFVDCCEHAGRNVLSLRSVLRQVQRIETESLLSWIRDR